MVKVSCFRERDFETVYNTEQDSPVKLDLGLFRSHCERRLIDNVLKFEGEVMAQR